LTAGSFLTRLDADGMLIDSTMLPDGVGGLDVAVDSSGNPVTLGGSEEAGGDASGQRVLVRAGGVLTGFIGSGSGAPRIYSLQNAGSTSAASRLAPGELLVVNGVNLGPDPRVAGRPDWSGKV